MANPLMTVEDYDRFRFVVQSRKPVNHDTELMIVGRVFLHKRLKQMNNAQAINRKGSRNGFENVVEAVGNGSFFYDRTANRY